MNYHIVFDVSHNGSQLVLWLLPPLFALLLGFIGWALRGSGDQQLAPKGLIFMAVSAIGFALSLVGLGGILSEYHEAKKALETGNYQVVEGTVSNFVPMPPGGHSTEHFQVGGLPFGYGSGWGSVTFNSEWNHGYIHNGSQVRIAYKGQDILRIELR